LENRENGHETKESWLKNKDTQVIWKYNFVTRRVFGKEETFWIESMM
jgi:hypothetical protein